MKNVFSILITVIMFSTVSCSSDNDDDLSPTTNPPQNTGVNYTSNIKPLIDGNCTSCHGTTLSNGAPMPLTTAAQVEQAITSRNLIGRVENGTMPPSGNLSAAQVQSIKDWQTAGFPN
jgi:mono/diheme cytochrome c family protein